MTVAELERLIGAYAAAAERARSMPKQVSEDDRKHLTAMTGELRSLIPGAEVSIDKATGAQINKANQILNSVPEFDFAALVGGVKKEVVSQDFSPGFIISKNSPSFFKVSFFYKIRRKRYIIFYACDFSLFLCVFRSPQHLKVPHS